jgi:hypothetical protein
VRAPERHASVGVEVHLIEPKVRAVEGNVPVPGALKEDASRGDLRLVAGVEAEVNAGPNPGLGRAGSRTGGGKRGAARRRRDGVHVVMRNREVGLHESSSVEK